MFKIDLIWKDLEAYHVVKDPATLSDCLKSNLDILLGLVKERMIIKEAKVTASILMRYVAFLFVGELFVLSKYRHLWVSDNEQIGLIEHTSNGIWAPKWTLTDGDWVPLAKSENIATVIQRMVDKQSTIINLFAEKTGCAKVVLWENVWGYLHWMYTQFFQNPENPIEQGRHDFECLLNSKAKSGYEFEEYSPYARFLKGKSPEEALSSFDRITCCYYYRIPGHDKCTYCPRIKK